MAEVKFKSFSSGSCGNCYFVGLFSEDGNCEAGILIDAGVSPRRLKKELLLDGLDPGMVNAMLVTHDHMDHVRSLASHCKHISVPVWATPTLCKALAWRGGEYFDDCRETLREGWNEVVPGRIRVQYFEVPHDATQTVGYAIMLDDYKFVIMTDIGRMTQQAAAFASQADTVAI